MRRLKIRKAVILLVLLSACVSFSCRRNPPPVTTGGTPPPPPPPPPPPTPAPTISLTATPATVNAGQAVTLAWQSTNATTVGIQPEIGNVTAIGNRQVTPASSVTYTATANGPGGSATAVARVTVNAAPPPPPPTSVPDRPVVTSLSDQFRAQFENQPVLFDYDKSDIRADQVARLQSHANFLKKNTSVRISIEGHADERGSQEYNVALGDERAASVMKYLVEQGVAATRMSTVSYGEERPVCRTQDEGCYQQNRRAAFVMVN